MALQGSADPPRNQDNAGSNTVTVVTRWAEPLPAPSVSSLQDKAGTLSPQPQHKPLASRETLLQQYDKDKMVPRHIPRLRAVVESQAFKNVLVDEMDMMLSRAATLIQANWRGYRLRQKLISQMMAAKAIQEAWRRFNTRRLLRSGKLVEKKVSMEEGDIPYHAPQQVRFQHPKESKPPVAPPVMVSKETQFPSSNTLAACTHQLAFLQAQLAPPCTTGDPGITFLPHQTVAMRLPCPASLDAKCHPCLLTRTVRNPCLVHVEGDTVKTKQVITRASKAGAPGPLPCGRYAQAVHGSLKTQAQTHVETEVLKAPLQTGPPQMYPVAAMPKTPPQPCLVPTVTLAKTPPQVYPVARMTRTLTQMYPAAAMTKTPPQTYPAVAITKTPLQSCLAAMMNKTPPQPCSAPTVTITKAPPQTYQVGPVARSPPQTCPVAAMTKTSPQASQPAAMSKTPLQSCLAALVNKTPPQPCPAAPMSKTPTQMRPTASMTNTSPQTRPAAIMAKISPQICLLASMIKPQTQTRPVATMTKAPPQTCPVPAMTKTPTQMRPVAPMTKTPLQTCPAAAMAKTPSQTLPGASVTKTPPQTRLAAMVTKTPAQFRSMAAILRTLCLPPSAGGNLKSSPPVAVAAGIPNASSHTSLNGPKAKAVVNTKQTAGMVRVSSHSYLAEGKIKYFNSPHLGAGAPKAPAKPPLEAEKMKVFSQKEVKTETVSSTSVAIETPRASPWVKMAEDRNKSSLQTHLRADVKVQSQVYAPGETAVVLPRAQLATCPAKAMPQTHLDTCLAKALPQERLATCSTTASSQGQLLAELTAVLPQAHLGTCLSKTLPQAHPHARLTTTQAQTHLGTCLSKALSQAHPPAKLTKAPSFAHLGTCLTKAQSQAHLATGVIKVQSQAHQSIGLTKVQSQAQLVPETAKCLHTAHQAAELSGKTQSQPLLAGFKASTQPCQHVGALGTPPRAKPEDRLTQIQPHSYVQGKGTPGPRQGASETRSMLVPLLASAGHPTCNIESWGDSGATRAQSPMPSPATPCPEELTASQLASLGTELAAELGSQEDLRALLVKALSQGQVKAALNQALSKRVLGSTMAKALPQGMLGTALMKMLSWGELGLALSRTLSPGELRAELTKAKQGKLADVLSKALTEEEWAALSQALCQGELGAVLSQSLSQAALRTGVVLPKASSKTAGNRMTVIPAPVEVDHRGIPSTAWGPALGPVRPQPSKVRVPQDGAWEGFSTGWPARFLEEMGDGAMLGGSPCFPVVSMGASLASRVITAIHQYPLIAALDPSLSWEMESSRGSSSDLYLSPEVSEENVCLPPGASELASDLNPVESDTDPSLPKPPHLQLPPSLWQPLIANGVGPSTSQQSVVAGGRAPSSHKPHAVSRVAPRLWASSGEGRVASGMLPRTAGAGRALHSHQSTAAYGASVCCCQPSGVNKVPSSRYRPSATKVPRQPPVVREETMQKTQSPNHKQASVNTRERINKATPGPLRAATVSKMSLTQPQNPKAGDITLGLLPGSMAPGPRWALKTQADPSVFPASPGRRFARTLSRTAVPRQERNQNQGTISSARCPPERVTGHILNELAASLPQGPDNDMAGSLSQGSIDYGPNVSNSQSSLPSCGSLSLSTMSVASLTAVELVEQESWEACLDGDIHLDTLLSGEAVGRPQRPRDREETKKAGWGHMTPNLYEQPSAGSELIPILHHSSVSGRMTLSVHWSSDDQDERDMTSGQSSMDLRERLSQKSYRTGLTRSLSLDNVVPTTYQQPSAATRLTSSLSQSPVVSKMAPNPGQPFMVSKVTCSTSELSMATKVIPSLTEPPRPSKVNLSLDQKSWASGMTPSLAQPSTTGRGATNIVQPFVTGEVAPSLAQATMTSGVALSLAQPSVTSGVAPSLAQPSVTGGVAPSLGQVSMTSGVAPSLAPPSMTSGVAPSLAQASMASAVAPSLARPSVTGGVAPSLSQASMTSGVAPSLAQPSVTSGVTPSLAQPSMIGGVTPSLSQASVTGDVAPSRAQPSVISGVAPSLSQASVTGGVAPSLAQATMTSGVVPSLAQVSMTSGVAPSLAQPSVTGGVAPSLGQVSMTSGVAPSLAPPSMTSGVAPSLAQASMTGAVAPSLAQATMTSGVVPSLAQTSMTSGVAPSLAQPPVTGGVAPSLSQASMTSGVALSLAQPSVTSGVAPSLAQPSVTGGVAPSLGQVSMTSGVAPSLAPPSMTSGVAPSLAQASMTGAVAPSLAQATMTSGVVPSLAQTSMTSGVAPSLSQASMTSGVALSLAQPSVTSGVAPSLAQPSVTGGVAPSLGQVSKTSGVAPSLAPPSMTSGVVPSLAQASMTSAVAPSLARPSVTGGVAPSLSQASMTSGVAPSLAQPSMIGGMTPSLSQASVTGDMAPSRAQPSVISGVAPSLSQASVTGGVAPSLAQASMTSGVAPNLARPSVASGMAPSLARPSVTSGVAPSLARPSVASGMAPSLARPSVTSGVAPSLAQASMTSGVAPSLAQQSVASGVAPSLAQPSVTAGVVPSLARPSVTGGVAPSLARPSVTGGVAPSLARPSVTGGVAPSLARPSVTGGVAPSLARPSVTGGVAPSLARSSVTGGVAPSLARPSVTVGVAPSLARPSMTSGEAPSLSQASVTVGVAPSLARPSMTSGEAPSLTQPSVTVGVAPSLARPSVTSGEAPSLAKPSITKLSMRSGVTPSLAKPSVTSAIAPSLAKPCMTDGVAPVIAQPSVACVVAPSVVQPSVACVVAPSLVQPSVACVVVSNLARPPVTGGVAPSLAHSFVANRGPLSLFQPSVIGGTSCPAGQSGWVPTVGSNLPPRANAVAPSLHHPSFVTEVPWSTSYSSAMSSPGQDLSQSPVAAGMAPCQDSVMVGGVTSNAQVPEFSEVSLAFHQPLGVGGGRPSITEHSEVTLSAPNLYQASGVSGEDSCLDQGTSVCAGALFRGAVAAGMFPNTSRGTLAAGMFLSMSPGPVSPGMTGSVCQRSVTTGLGPNQFQMASGVTPIASPAPVAGAPLIHKQASEGPGFSRASVPNRLGTSPFRFSQANAGASMPQVNVDLPVSLNHQHPSVSTITAPGYEQANAFSQEPVMDTASGLVPGSVASRMTTALARGTVASGVAPRLPPGSVIRGVGQSLSPGSVISAVPPHLPPGYVVGGVAQTLPEGSVICGISHSLPPGSVISGMGQGLPPDPMASAVAQNFPPGPVASGVPPSLMATSGAGGKRQSFIRPSVSFTSPSLIPGSVSSGMGPGVSPGSVASSVVPAIDPGGLNQGLILGSTDNAAGLPSTVGNVAQSLPQGSMLIGISPRPYHGALPGEGSTAPFQASHATGLAHLQPQALESSGTTRRVLQVPTVLQRASQLSHALEMMPFEATDGQARMKPEDLSKAVSQVSASSAESMVLDATPWMSHNPLSTDHSHELLPDGQRPLLEMIPSQTKSLASGMTPVPPQSLNFAKHCVAGGTTPTLQQRSATSWEAPSSHFVTASRVPSVHMEPVKVTGAPLTRQASVAHVVPQSPSVTHRVPQGHAHKMGASPMVSGSPKLVHSSTMASSVYPGSLAGVGTPSTSQRPGTTHKTSHMLYPPTAGGIASGGFQVEAVPRAHKKPESGDLTRSNHKFLGSRKSYRFMHGCLVSDMLDGNVARVVPLPEVQEHASGSSQESPEHSKSAPPAVIPIIHTTEVAHNTTVPKLPLGFRRVSLGYESSPDGSRRPLFTPESMQGSRDFHSAVAPAGSHRASLTPTVLQGPVDAGIAGGQAWNSAVPGGAVGPVSSAGAPGGAWDQARAPVPWDTAGREAAEDPRQSGELVTSMQAVEKIIIRAVVTIQACARGYLVRRTIKVWHQWAVIIQAAWRGYRVRRNLVRLSQAATTIQATWRGFCTRRNQTQAALLPGAWTKTDSRTKSASDHHCFQSCQPHLCPLCQSLSPRPGSPPSVVMLVGSSPRTCHMCGHTLPTRVVHGMGRGSRVQAGVPWACGTLMASRSPQQSHRQHKAATAIQSAWRGFTVRRWLRQQQMAARMLHATRRSHHTRASLTTDALLGPAGWDNSQHMQWPGV
ncbi:LOW QUALITY PROTEIN: IQ domain-containing protein N [Mirounga angustirostris]|uniref:LOW QUALITY PROTEIN: IQ domain-containing protein N n=1 Tax=Mirounga angustirostris TaxID=9716 RepID=UPI00313BF4FE